MGVLSVGSFAYVTGMRVGCTQLAKVREILDRRDPAEMFDFFDTDKSGAIEFGEFTAMLPMLGIQMSDAKAFKQVSLLAWVMRPLLP